jgi:DNA adenine methylase
LAAYVKRLMKVNRLLDGEYVEPYAGGAAIALELLFQEYVQRIHINDISRPVHAFWNSVLHQTEELCELIIGTPLTVEAWDTQKRVLVNESEHDDLAVGFATFFLNRTNRSGILNAGIIGGRNQTGPWKIDARYNSSELAYRIQAIASIKERISLSRLDALQFLKSGIRRWSNKTLIYLDPPYYVKGRDLYHDFYKQHDHEIVSRFVKVKITSRNG